MFDQVDAHFDVLRTAVARGRRHGVRHARRRDRGGVLLGGRRAAVPPSPAQRGARSARPRRAHGSPHRRGAAGGRGPAGPIRQPGGAGDGARARGPDPPVRRHRRRWSDRAPTRSSSSTSAPHRLRDLAEPERIWQVRHPALADAFPPVRGIDALHEQPPAATVVVRRSRRDLARPRVDGASAPGRDADRRRWRRQDPPGGARGGRAGGRVRQRVVRAAGRRGPTRAMSKRGGGGDRRPPAPNEPLAAMQMLAGRSAHAAGHRQLRARGRPGRPGWPTPSPGAARSCTCSRRAVRRSASTASTSCPVRPARRSPPRAVDLFRERAVAAGADLGGRGATRRIEHLCTRLDGLPLAIELAAARTPSLGVDGVLRALDEGAPLGGLGPSGPRRAPRHPAGHDRVVVPAARGGRAAAVRAGWPRSRTGSSSTPPTTWPRAMGLDPRASARGRARSARATEHGRGRPDPDGHSVPAARDDAVVRARAARAAVASDRSPGAALAEWMADVVRPPAQCARARAEVERRARSASSARPTAGARRRCSPPQLGVRGAGRSPLWTAGRVVPARSARPRRRGPPAPRSLASDPAARRAVLSAMLVSASSSTDAAEPRGLGARGRGDRRARSRPGSAASCGGWRSAWQGDFVSSVRVCLEPRADDTAPGAGRSATCSSASRCSTTTASPPARRSREGLVDRALEIADRTDVALTRVLCRLGAAWALVAVDPNRLRSTSSDSALDDVASDPRAHPPGAARERGAAPERARSQRCAAKPCSSRWTVARPRRSVRRPRPAPLRRRPARAGRAGGGSGGARARAGPAARADLSMMDFVDLARRASSRAIPASILEFESTVRERLVVDGHGRGPSPRDGR